MNVNWLSEDLVLDRRLAVSLSLKLGWWDMPWLDKSLGGWLVSLLVHQEFVVLLVVLLLLLQVYSMLLFKFILMLYKLVLLVQVVLVFRLEHLFMIILLLFNQLSLFLKIFGLASVLVMSDVSLILINLFIQISMDFFS